MRPIAAFSYNLRHDTSLAHVSPLKYSQVHNHRVRFESRGSSCISYNLHYSPLTTTVFLRVVLIPQIWKFYEQEVRNTAHLLPFIKLYKHYWKLFRASVEPDLDRRLLSKRTPENVKILPERVSLALSSLSFSTAFIVRPPTSCMILNSNFAPPLNSKNLMLSEDGIKLIVKLVLFSSMELLHLSFAWGDS
ncbi:hypothetical protein LSTR_LSTR001249 [Laodelphax striatellus]|uniref:Uncharacterized protein n=1 Tax=Laodelphax striatellus TaxID=195883 RepID=A0A482XCR0_LAOST|nr:hypothetical protein LSTR_LSTR001249 [Laodelphax striatellus]